MELLLKSWFCVCVHVCVPWNWQTTVGTYVVQLWIYARKHLLQYSTHTRVRTRVHTHTFNTVCTHWTALHEVFLSKTVALFMYMQYVECSQIGAHLFYQF
jgi:hypothetical protein